MLLRSSGITVIAGSVLFLAVPFLTSSLYQLTPEEQVAYVETHRSLVVIQNTLLALGGILVAAGYVLWSLHVRNQVISWLNWLAVVAFGLAAVALGGFFFQTTQDPASYYLAENISWVGTAYFVAASVGFVAYGLLFVSAGTGTWLGYLSVATGVGMFIALLAIGGKDLPPQPFFLVALIAGVVFLVNAAKEAS